MVKRNMKQHNCKKQEKNKPGFSSPHQGNGGHRSSPSSWRLENIFPPLTSDEYESLKESIHQFGVRVPIIVDCEGDIIDGRHRERVCSELGNKCPREVHTFESTLEKLQVAMSLNCNRRHMKLGTHAK